MLRICYAGDLFLPPHADTMGGVFGIMCGMVLRHRDDMGTRTHLCSAAVLLFIFAALGLRVPAATYCFQTSENRSDLNSSVCDAAEVPAKLEIGDTIDLSLPEGVAFSLSIVAAPPAGIAGQSYIAHDANSEASAVVKPTKDGLRVTVDDFENRRIYSVRVKDGVVTSSVRDVSVGDGGDVCGTCAAAGGQASAATSSGRAVSTKPPMSGARLLASPADAFPIAEHNPVVDILVAFDQGAKAWAESSRWPGGDTIEEFADYAVNKMNTVLENSQLLDKFSYRLVGVVEVDATYTAVEQSVLLALQSGSGALAKVAEMREKCGADTTTLLVNRTSPSSTTTGVGFSLNGTNDTDYASFAAANKNCNVCHIQRVYDRYTMSHETGHNMGCGHSNTQQSAPGPEPGPFPYSCGYHFTDAHGVRRHTVMAYQSDGVYTYNAVPYFSSPEIIPDEYGVPLGKAGTNDNRQVLFYTHSGVSTYREHVVPYDWDVRFLDDNGNDIRDGSYFYSSCYVTLTNSNPDAEIYYTLDGSTPTESSYHGGVGTKVYMYLVYGPRTLTACAVVDGVAQSVRAITLRDGLTWSGDAGGAGLWTASDVSARPWSGEYFDGSAVVFPDLAGVSSATVTVQGTVSPSAASFLATDTSYIFAKGDAAAQISLPDASFAPSGDLTFNVPVNLAANSFTTPANHTVTFNAPFGQSVTETTGYCTNFIGIGSAGTLVVSPGAGKTQYFDSLSTDWFFSSARFCVGEGTVVFKGPANGGKGVFANTGIVIGRGGNLVLDFSGSIAGQYSSISCDGTITFTSVTTANSKSWWTGSGWKGTVAFEGLSANTATQNFQFEKYGNADSKILLRNCAISYLKDNYATFPGTLVLEKDADGHIAFTTGNGYSEKYNVFGALEGDGAMSFTTGQRQGYVFGTATNYSGSISVGAQNNSGIVGGRYIVFGTVASASDLPANSNSATITVKPGATASIGGGATWSAYHGVDIAGTLLVKGAGATLDCNASAEMGLKLDDGATLRFETADAKLAFAKAPQFSAGTVGVAFASGVAPTNGMVLATWPDGSAPAGDFAFSDTALAERWILSKTTTGLVVENAPLPATVKAAITIQYYEGGVPKEKTVDVELPTGWATNYYPSLDTVVAVAAKYDDFAANGARVWQCYMLGLDPTDAASGVSLSMAVDGGKIKFSVEGLGETHAISGVDVYWAMKTSTNLVADAGFTKTRAATTGLSPTFPDHDMPDTPTSSSAAEPVDTLFYRLNATFYTP